MRRDRVEVTLCNQHSAVTAWPWADVDDPVGGAHHVLVMLDNEHRVADVAKAAQRGDQPIVVALMQSDGRFVEHIAHAHQPAADLSGKANALRFAAGKRRTGAVER